MNAAYNPYSNISSSNEINSSTPDKFSAIFIGYRNGSVNRGYVNKANNAAQLQQLEINDDMCPNYPHHQRIHSTRSSYKICEGCGDQIEDRYLLHALDRFWHNSCLKCHCCGTLLADVGKSCFTRRGLILCKKDYSSMFGCSGICSGCGDTIPPSEMVAKAVAKINHMSKCFENQKPDDQPLIFVFHLKCFACTKCGANLRPGDRYTMLGANIICELDWQKMLKNASATNSPVSTVRKGKVGRPRRNKEQRI